MRTAMSPHYCNRPESPRSAAVLLAGGVAPTIRKTLPTDSAERKEYPLADGVLAYFPAALAGVAKVSKKGNDKHNPGEPLHHARGKSGDHANCVLRHLMDVRDIEAWLERNREDLENECSWPTAAIDELMLEVDQLAWRALALSQELKEKWAGAPLAPGAKACAAPRS